ncbi:MAG: phosphoribosylformylglycinamidine cyclo-ligase [Sandaracinus sp.]|nr:phosphoribosylformylglycinamidine cyclo-ligase [Sandaracinus sp.]|tara:strand:- start:145 stop:1185 length:1041 start_codon:yes stop_codon:yes gene_type:complete
MGLTYEDAGVDIDAGERLVDRIKPLAAATRIPEVLGSVGGFAGLCGLPEGLKDPVLVSGTDGVGTKLEVAIQAGRHDTVGIDLVAMCVNDIVTVGARPLFFLDYFATGKLEVDQGEAVVRGIAEGCKQAGCALLGGETAELPGFYEGGRYDLAGFAVGVAERSQLLDGTKVQAGDVLLGLASSGLHSNGYSLARRALIHGDAALPLDQAPEGFEASLGEELLRPTRIYVKAALAALATGGVHALCHVTGGGLPGNLPRVLPEGLGAHVDGEWPEPTLFDLIRRRGDVAPAEMRRTFNLGIGFVVVVAADRATEVTEALQGAGETVHRLGTVEATDAQGEARVRYAG